MFCTPRFQGPRFQPLSKWLCTFTATSLACVLLSVAIARAEPVETEIPGVSAELIELRESGGVLRLAVRFVNAAGGPEVSGVRIGLAEVFLVDSATQQKHFGLRDTEGRFLAGPVSDWGDGGRWWPRLPGGGEAILWMLFEPVGPGTVLNVEVPRVFPFDDIVVTEGPGELLGPSSSVSTPGGLRAELIQARRSERELRVRLRIENPGVSLPSWPLRYSEVYAFDPASKRKYLLLRDAEGSYLARPMTNDSQGGSYWLNTLRSGASVLMSLNFTPPPDDVVTADIVIPGFLPFEGVILEGEGGAVDGGIAAAGRRLGFEGALRELAAEVTPQEIRIELSADVLFDFDEHVLKPSAEPQLQHLFTIVDAEPASRISIAGHTDVRGDAAYNQALSERRAQSVREWLLARGVAPERMTATGFGKTRPIRSGDSEEDHQANRRVEIRIERLLHTSFRPARKPLEPS